MDGAGPVDLAGNGRTPSAFVRALVDKDAAGLRALLADPVDFRSLAGSLASTAATPTEVVDGVLLKHWFDQDDIIRDVLWLRVDEVADTGHFAYRLRVRNRLGDYLVEQQAYYRCDGEGRIGWLRMLCSGYRPDPVTALT